MLMDDVAVESVIQELACTSSRSDCQTNEAAVPLTEEQGLLSISPVLVYLAGLVLLSNNHNVPVPPPFPDSMHVKFQAYCQLYNAHTQKDAKLPIVPVLSPRILPSPQQYKWIQQDVASRQARVSLESMLELQEQHDKGTTIQKKKKSAGKSRSKTAYSATSYTFRSEDTETTAATSVDSKKGTSSQTLEDVLGVQLHAATVLEDDASDWISVPPKTTTRKSNQEKEERIRLPLEKEMATLNKTVTPVELTATRRKISPHVAVVDSSKTTNAVDVMADQDSRGHDDESPMLTMTFSVLSIEADKRRTLLPQNGGANMEAPNLGPEISVQQHDEDREEGPTPQKAPQLPEESAYNMDDSVTMISQDLSDRIHQLESALAQANRLLELERKQRREEQERHANSMQALQLRLYISETRLKTYQDALDDHVQSVAENSYQPTTTLSSPPRGRSSASTTTDKDHLSTPSSPLISRVLQHSNRFETAAAGNRPELSKNG